MTRPVRLLFLTFALSFLVMGNVADARTSTPKVGAPAPNFTLTLVNKKVVTLADLRGQVVVLNFWATWCIPCRTELPTLDAYYRLQKSHGLRVFAITTENSVPERQLHEVFDAMAIEPIHKLKGPYQYINRAVPTNYVIDRAGVVRFAAAGAFDLNALNQILIPLLREPPPPDAKIASAS